MSVPEFECSTCRDERMVVDQPKGFRYTMPLPCPVCCHSAYLHEVDSIRLSQLRPIYHELDLALGNRYRTASLEDFDVFRPLGPTVNGASVPEDHQRVMLLEAQDAVQEYIDGGFKGWLTLVGSVGVGKTLLAAAIANEARKQRMEVAYAQIDKLLDYIRQGMNDYTSVERKEWLATVDLLVLDDLGTEHKSGWNESQLFAILDPRDQEYRSTVITTNKPLVDLPERIASRIQGSGRVIDIQVSDLRPLLRKG